MSRLSAWTFVSTLSLIAGLYAPSVQAGDLFEIDRNLWTSGSSPGVKSLARESPGTLTVFSHNVSNRIALLKTRDVQVAFLYSNYLKPKQIDWLKVKAGDQLVDFTFDEKGRVSSLTRGKISLSFRYPAPRFVDITATYRDSAGVRHRKTSRVPRPRYRRETVATKPLNATVAGTVVAAAPRRGLTVVAPIAQCEPPFSQPYPGDVEVSFRANFGIGSIDYYSNQKPKTFYLDAAAIKQSLRDTADTYKQTFEYLDKTCAHVNLLADVCDGIKISDFCPTLNPNPIVTAVCNAERVASLVNKEVAKLREKDIRSIDGSAHVEIQYYHQSIDGLQKYQEPPITYAVNEGAKTVRRTLKPQCWSRYKIRPFAAIGSVTSRESGSDQTCSARMTWTGGGDVIRRQRNNTTTIDLKGRAFIGDWSCPGIGNASWDSVVYEVASGVSNTMNIRHSHVPAGNEIYNISLGIKGGGLTGKFQMNHSYANNQTLSRGVSTAEIKGYRNTEIKR